MPPVDELYVASKARAAPYGPGNPAPPPPGSPHLEGSQDICQQQGGKTETPQRRSSRQTGQYGEEGRGRQRPSSPWRQDDRRSSFRYRERTSSPWRQDDRRDSFRYRGRSPVRDRSMGANERERPTRRSPSVRRNPEGRRRSRSPRREEDDYEDSYRNPYTRGSRQRSNTPVSFREQRVRNSNIPETAYPLRNYTKYVTSNYEAINSTTRGSQNFPIFRNGHGKVNPSTYGSVVDYDFGLCYGTFMSHYACEMETACPWRHHPLSAREKSWMRDLAPGKAGRFLDKVEDLWAKPSVPVPGCNMIEVMNRERDDMLRR